MKKLTYLVYISFLLFHNTFNAQVGIGNTSPDALLDITAKNSLSPNSNDGLLIPRLDRFPSVNPGVNQNAMLIFLNNNLTGVNINGTPRDYLLGYYYWDNIRVNWIKISTGNGWVLEGNNNAVSGTHFIGTTNNEEVDFRVNTKLVARLTELGQLELQSDKRSTFIGFEAGENYNPLGVGTEDNVYVGYQSGKATNSGGDNVAVGSSSLSTNTSGSFNTAVGSNALLDNTTGINNTAIGSGALEKTLGSGNIAIGSGAGEANIDGSNNVILGFDANLDSSNIQNTVAIGLSSRVGGNDAIAIGSNANSSKINTVAIGVNSVARSNGSIAIGGDTNSDSDSSLAIGNNTRIIRNSSNSTAIGINSEIIGGSINSTLIGNQSSITNDTKNSISFGNKNILGGGTNNSIAIGNEIRIDNGKRNAVGIGFQASPTKSNQIRLGGNSVKEVLTSGRVIANSFLATGSNTSYADYVFENYFDGYSKIKSDYKFLTIEEAELFVRKNGHLPGVKSYKEVMKGGFNLDLTDATIKNLEKIEEQFLYITELKKEIKNQDKKIELLDQRFKALEQLIKKE